MNFLTFAPKKSYNFFPNFGNTLESSQTLDTFFRYDITMMQDGTERQLRICIIIMNKEGSLFAYIKGLAANSAQPLPGRPTTSRFADVIPLSAAETFTYKPYNIRIPPEEGCQKFRIPDFLSGSPFRCSFACFLCFRLFSAASPLPWRSVCALLLCLLPPDFWLSGSFRLPHLRFF